MRTVILWSDPEILLKERVGCGKMRNETRRMGEGANREEKNVNEGVLKQ